jgi:very-short-patch-repair endonuclease
MIRCPLCGQEFRFLGTHIAQKHKLKISDFKARFPNIPTLTEDVSKAFSKRSKESMTKFWQSPESTSRRQQMSKVGRMNKKPRILIQCLECGKPIETYITSSGKPYRRFCSLACATRYKNLNNNPMNNSETRKKMIETKRRQALDPEYRKYLVKVCKPKPLPKEVLVENGRKVFQKLKTEGRLKEVQLKGTISALRKMRRGYRSSAEIAMEAILQNLNVRFKANEPLKTNSGTFFPDFIILNCKPQIIIEVDGEWHIRRADHDNRKNKAYLEQGFSVLRFSSYEIKKHPSIVRQFVEDSLKQHHQVFRSWMSGGGKLKMLSALPSQKRIDLYAQYI